MKPASSESAPATLARWTEEEHRILVQLTEAQVALETKQPSKTLSWSKHWERVSAQLKEQGYNRTPAACGLHWKRNPDSQRATEAAAGAPWTDAEHEILLRMTNHQLAREEADPSTRMSWGDLWEEISIALGESGFDRPADECDAHWNMVENGRWHPTPKKIPDSRPVEASSGNRNEKEHPSKEPPRAPPTTEIASARPWTNAEHENLLQVFHSHYDPAQQHDYWGEGVWTLIAQVHQRGGFKRSWQDCITYWRTDGRFRKGLDESPDQSSKARTPTTSAGPRSPVRSRVTKVEQDPESVNLPADNGMGSANFSNVYTEAAESEMSEYEPVRSARKQKSTNTRGPASPESPAQKSKPKYSRLSEEKRAILIGEVEKNGPYVDNDRRLELALQLGVEESTIKNWFTNYRSKKNRESLNSAPENSNHSHLESQSPLEMGKKRRRDTFNPIEFNGPPGPPSDQQQSKRRRLEEEPVASPANPEPTVAASPAQHSSASRSLSQSERSEASRATPRGTEVTSPATPIESPTWQAINSLPSNKKTGQAQTPIAANPQAAAAIPVPLPTPEADSDESRKASAAREVQRFQMEIEALNRGKSETLERIDKMHQSIEEVNQQKDQLQDTKLREISRVLAEIEARYKLEHERLQYEQERLNGAKEAELKAVDRSTSKITQKQKALGHWLGLVEFYADPENND